MKTIRYLAAPIAAMILGILFLMLLASPAKANTLPSLYRCYTQKQDDGLYVLWRQVDEKSAVVWIFNSDGEWVNQGNFAPDYSSGVWLTIVNNIILILGKDDEDNVFFIMNTEDGPVDMECK